jgi:hypothetical protein
MPILMPKVMVGATGSAADAARTLGRHSPASDGVMAVFVNGTLYSTTAKRCDGRGAR